MATAFSKDFLSAIYEFVPCAQVYTDELRTLAWGTDGSFYRMTPQMVIRAENEQQVSHIVQVCSRYKISYTFRAAGTSLSGQSCTDSVLIVAGKHWEDYEVSPDHSSIRMQPGLVGSRVNRILKPFGRLLPPDPASVNSAMIGGIVNNNASGMNCGVHANSDNMLISARIVLADGTILDTGNKESRDSFRSSHSEFLARIESLRDKVRANKQLSELISYKYSIKNVTGLNIRPLIAYDDPFDIIAHSIVGSEGTLAFLSEVNMRTLHDYPYKASAMVYFLTMKESCNAVVKLKQLKGPKEDIEMIDSFSIISGDEIFGIKREVRAHSGIISATADVSSFQRKVSPQSVTTVGPLPEIEIPAIFTFSALRVSSSFARKKASYQEQATKRS